MRKIIIFIPSLEYGGAERVTTRLASSFSNDYEVNIVTLRKADIEYKINNDINRINIENSNYLGIIMEIRQVVKKINPEFVIVMFAPMFPIIYFSLLGLKIPKIVSERNDPSNFSGKDIIKLIYQILLKKSDGIVFQTEQAQKYYFPNGSEKARIIYNPICIDELPELHEGLRKKEVVAIGRLHPQKNHKLLINAFAKIHHKIPDYKLVIYGEGDLRDELTSLKNSKGCSEYINLYGKTNNVLEKIKEASLFVLSSNYEGMPNALLEAMAMGVPVISTDCPCGGPSELITDEINGLLVGVGDEDGLANAILKMLNNHDKANKMALNALNIRSDLSIELISKQWLEFCQHILKGRK